MYSYRSGCMLSPFNKQAMWWVCMLPFFYAFVMGNESGLQWFTTESMQNSALFHSAVNSSGQVLRFLAYVLPFVFFVVVAASKSGPMPLICLLTIVTNGIWWILLPTRDAFVWATVFHGIQYMAIVVVFHMQDQVSRPTNRHGPLYHVVWFYAASVMLGYALFSVPSQGIRIGGVWCGREHSFGRSRDQHSPFHRGCLHLAIKKG